RGDALAQFLDLIVHLIRGRDGRLRLVANVHEVALCLRQLRSRVRDRPGGLIHPRGQLVGLLLEALLETPDVRQRMSQQLQLTADLLYLTLPGEHLRGVLVRLRTSPDRSTALNDLPRERDRAA